MKVLLRSAMGSTCQRETGQVAQLQAGRIGVTAHDAAHGVFIALAGHTRTREDVGQPLVEGTTKHPTGKMVFSLHPMFYMSVTLEYL